MVCMSLCIAVCVSLIALVLAVLLYKSKKQYHITIDQLNEQIAKHKQETEEAKQKMIKAESDLESRTALLRDVSHEVRSRLHGIVSLSEILSTRWSNVIESDRRVHIDSIFNSSFEMFKLMNDLLDFSKFDAGKMVFDYNEMNLVDSINEAVKYCNRMYLLEADSRLQLINKITDKALIKGDKERIHQLIMNLLINAIKYSGKGRIIAELKEINYSGKSYWEFILTDEGTGIPKDELENIFEPFTQSTRHKPSKKIGSGLGLALCKQIIEAHSGSIWAENNSSGPGAKFSFIIPTLNKEDENQV